MNKIYKIFTLFIAAMITGCGQDFLDTELIRSTDDETYYSTENEVFSGLIAAYDPLGWTFAGGRWSSAVMLGEIRSDNAHAGGDPTNNDQPGWQSIDDLTADGTLGESESFWEKYYTGIRRTNLVILRGDLGTETTDRYIAEAKFLRAYYHFELFRTFGPVPVIDYLVTPDDFSLQRDNMSTLFTLVVSDLEAAIDGLPSVAELGSEGAGRATVGAAQGLLGKAYLYWADLDGDNTATFDLAAAQFDAVISAGEYSLLDDYNDLYAFRNDFSAESVFEISHSNIETVGWEWPNGIAGNMMIQLCGIRGLCGSHPEYVAGWGFMMPTQDLVDEFLSDDTYRMDATVIDEVELSADGCAVDASEQNFVDFEGYWQQKFANFSAYDAPLGGDLNTVKDGNEIYMRFADILLMAAEALERGSGSAGTAETYVDMVRERAAGPGDNTGSFRTATQVMSDEGWSLLELIHYERRAELAGEGDRWFDLVRRGEFTASSFDGSSDIRIGNYSEEDQYLPISQLEVDRTGGSLTLYPDASLFQ